MIPFRAEKNLIKIVIYRPLTKYNRILKIQTTWLMNKISRQKAVSVHSQLDPRDTRSNVVSFPISVALLVTYRMTSRTRTRRENREKREDENEFLTFDGEISRIRSFRCFAAKPFNINVASVIHPSR